MMPLKSWILTKRISPMSGVARADKKKDKTEGNEAGTRLHFEGRVFGNFPLYP